MIAESLFVCLVCMLLIFAITCYYYLLSTQEELWEGDICMTSIGPAASPRADISAAKHLSSLARKQEIFLDILASQCAVSLQMEFLMNAKFEKALSPPELQLRDAVCEFEEKLKR